MPDYIALIHEGDDGFFGVTFPDLPGIFTGGDSLDEALSEAEEALAFAAEDWQDVEGEPMPSPRSIEQLRADAAFRQQSADAVVVSVPLRDKTDAVD